MERLSRVHITIGGLVLGVALGTAAMATAVHLPEIQRRLEAHRGLVRDLGTCRQALAAETDQAQATAPSRNLSACRQWLTTAGQTGRTALASPPAPDLIVQTIARHDPCEGAAFQGEGTPSAAF